MKKNLLLLLSLVLVLVLAACGGNSDTDKDGNVADDVVENGNNNENAENIQEEVTLKVGASSTPHAIILEKAKPILAEKGITLEIEEYEDYVLPNDDVDNGTLDANYFQHIPYLEQTIEDTGYELTNVGGIHIEPMGAYSQSISNIDDIPEGTEVVLSNSVSDHGRVLGLFQDVGLITLDESVDVQSSEIKDIVDNPKDLKFTAEYEPALLPEIYHSEKDIIVVINTNYAIGAELNPIEDSIFIEGKESPYVNIIAARTEDKDSASLKTLVEVLLSEEIQDFIIEEFESAVVPVK